MSNKKLKRKFIYPFGAKISGYNEFNPEMDITDQRAPINQPQELFEQFVIDDEIHDELENEKIEDFDSDIYDYDDRTEYGLDIAASHQAAFASAAGRLASRKKSKRAS